MKKVPVVQLGNGDVLRALDADGEWYWTGADPERGQKRAERTKDPEVCTGRREKADLMILADMLAAGGPGKNAEGAENAEKKGWISSGTPMLVGMPKGGVIRIRMAYPKTEGTAEFRAAWSCPTTRWSRLRARLCALCASVVKFLDHDGLWLAGLMLSLVAVVLATGGCAARVGTRFDQDQAGRSSINGGPNRLAVNFPDSETTSTEGVGPSSYSVTSGDEVRTLNQGVTPRQIFFKKLPDGTLAVNVSSGSDVEAEGLVYEPESGTFAVEKFRTLTSEPIRAGNEGYAALVDYWKSRDDASRAVLIEQIRASTEIATDLKGVLIGALTGIP